MKKVLLTGVATLGLACGAFAQGSFALNGSLLNWGVAINNAGTYYDGTAGIEIWELNGTVNASLISAINSASTGVAAYDLLNGNGFTREVVLPNKTITTGIINVGSQAMAHVTPAGSTVTVALAVWNNNAADWTTMLANATADTRGGVLAFQQGTANAPNPVPVVAWAAQDLVMTPVPEPGTFALAGLGAAALLIFRRRK